MGATRRVTAMRSTRFSFFSGMTHPETMVTTLRLYVLRAAYLMVAVFLTTQVLPNVIMRGTEYPHMSAVARALLGALGLLALLGIRYPLKMLPILLFELAWKAIWVLAIGLPLRAAGTLDAGQAQTFIDCTFGVVVCLVVIPWPYVITAYVRGPGDRWGRAEPDGSRQADAF